MKSPGGAVERHLDGRLRSGAARLGSPGLPGVVLDLARATGARRALDVGCGCGELAGLLAEAGLETTGVDLCPALLARARARVPAGTTLLEGDASSLPLPDARYDLVTSVLVLHYLDDPGRALAEAFRVLRPGGRLILADRITSPAPTRRIRHHRIEGLRNPWISRFLAADELEAAVARAGFRLESAAGHEDRLTLAEWTAGMDPEPRRLLLAEAARTPVRDLGGIVFGDAGLLRLRIRVVTALRPA